MLGSSNNSAGHLQALNKVEAWARERFKLSQQSAVVVSEIACGLPGCPPLETVVVFWTLDDKRHQFKIFKPVAQVDCDDLPYAWLMDSLAVPDGYEWGCC